ncbi:MAG: hypothetical protein NC081_10395 [Roseburia sp.]|nr:hypothetical protein [Roseburia sp.]
MSWKKNIFSYLMWFLYSVAVGSGLFGMVAFIGSRAGQPLYQAGLLSVGILLLSGFCVFWLNRLSVKLLKERTIKAHYILRAEIAGVILLLAAGIWLRIGHSMPAVDGSGYFEPACVSANQVLPQVVHGAEYLYLLFLHGVCILFGNRLEICIWSQVLVQLLAGMALYFGVRKLLGVLPGLTLLAFMMLPGVMIEEAFVLSPRPLYLLLYGVGLILVSEGIQKTQKFPVLGLLAGLQTGFLLYLDILGITLLVIIVSVFYRCREKTRSGERLQIFLVSLAGLVAGYFVCTLVDALLSGGAWANVIRAWGNLYMPEYFDIPEQFWKLGNYGNVLALFGMLSLGIFSFFCQRRKENVSVLGLMGILIAVGGCVGCLTQQLYGYDLLYLLLAALAGAGLSNISGAFGLTEGELQTQEAFVSETQVQEGAAGLPEASQPQLQYIENPLPLPKKHEKRVLDYDYFVADDDDFD